MTVVVKAREDNEIPDVVIQRVFQVQEMKEIYLVSHVVYNEYTQETYDDYHVVNKDCFKIEVRS